MAQRIKSFLVVLLLMFSFPVFGQEVPDYDTLNISRWDCLPGRSGIGKKFSSPAILIVNKGDHRKLPASYHTLDDFRFEQQLRLDFRAVDATRQLKPSLYYLLRRNPLQPDHAITRLGFFCRKELQLDRLSPVALRFRLGSLDYVNWMEQKPNAVKPLR